MDKTAPVIPHIIEQHAEEAAFLWLLRDRAVFAPHYNLKDLLKLDGRVEAHIDGLRIAGDYSWEVVENNLQAKEAGEVFAAAVLALEGKVIERINAVYQIAEENPATFGGLVTAFGWVEPRHLQGKVNGLLVSEKPFWRRVGIAACAIHRVDPGKFLEPGVMDDNPQLRATALQVAGELKRIDLKPLILNQVSNQDPLIGFWAAWASVLLGDRGIALNVLRNSVIEGAEFAFDAMQLAFRVLDPPQANELLKTLVHSDNSIRHAVIGAGITGDPSYLPWLIKQMAEPKLAKIAGEAFSFISGVDIAFENLTGELPKDYVAGPTENPEDENVAMDPDEDLACPDPALIDRWWKQHQQSFKPNVRYLSGKPVTQANCEELLRSAKQRQRIAAALELALMQPAKPLFETRAMAKRQRQWLDINNRGR